MRVYCDFDGTLTTVHAADDVLSQLAHPSWETLQAERLAGRISAAECIHRQIALIDASEARLDEVLDAVELSAGFPELVRWCRDRGMSLTIVSDGVDYFIRHILHRYGLGDIPTIANHLSGNAFARKLDQPGWRTDGNAGADVCKCAATLSEVRQTVVFIGDGRSDFCISHRSDVLFARDQLARYARERRIPFLPFENFRDVLHALASLADARGSRRSRTRAV